MLPHGQALEKALLKHNELLISRHAKMNDVASLHVQNNELKALLNQYLASRVRANAKLDPAPRRAAPRADGAADSGALTSAARAGERGLDMPADADDSAG